MKLGIYGGTFNPLHLGHLNSARFAMETLGLDQVLFIPDSTPPHKVMPAGSASEGQRLEMTALAVDWANVTWHLDGKFQVSDLEQKRKGKSYTADTMKDLRKLYPDDELWFLMGTDMLMTLHLWQRPETICKLSSLCAFCREEGDKLEELEAQADFLRRTYGANVRVIPLPQVTEVSSTAVRQELAQGNRPEFLPLPLWGYVLRHGLYGTKADLTRLTNEELEACSLSMVFAKRHRHILGVAETAERLARQWGEDPDLAWKAGILHDCTKYLSLEEHLQICARYSLPLDKLEAGSAKLLHSKTGAALARHIYGQGDKVCEAIFCHTTGKPEMSLLDKILYLADYMEPNRDFPGVEELRRLCDTDLDKALLMGLQMSVDDLTQRQVPIHPNTQGALDWAKALQH